MKHKWVLIFLLLSYSMSCTNVNSNVPTTPRDTTITNMNAVSDLFFDSSKLESFIRSGNHATRSAQRLRNFYNSRNYQFAWFTEDGLAEQTRSFWNLHEKYIREFGDSSIMDMQLHDRMNLYINEETGIYNRDFIIETEFRLTEHFFEYAQYAYAGKVNPDELQWHIPRKKVNSMALLDSLIANKGKNIGEWEPVSEQYKLMKLRLKRYHDIDKDGSIRKIDLGPTKTYRRGESSLIVKQLKQRLQTLGGFTGSDTSKMFTSTLVVAVKQAQKRFGIKQDGRISASLINELNVPIKKRIEQMLINMERMRWMPKESPGNRIVVNIPDFKMHVFESSRKVMEFDIVVGTSAKQTVIFNNMLKYVVFSPYWNIPESIVQNEILPEMRRSSNYLARMNMEEIGLRNGLPVIRQKPGSGNALGRVKFIFPNSFNIYFHDTPSKSLFLRNKRAFSHGCIRIAHPHLLAKYLLDGQPQWTADSIHNAMRSSEEKWVTLGEPLPVIITYLTSWIDNDGLLNFREDIYGHDAKMAEHLFEPVKSEGG